MTIQPIGAASVALYLTPADLKEHGLTPEGLTRELALTLTRDAFLRAGLPAEGPLEIEAYPDACGVLVFARRSEPPRIWLAFPDLEGLLAAARALLPLCGTGDEVAAEAASSSSDGSAGAETSLSLPAGEEQTACRLSEFGAEAEQAPFLDARLTEHARLILPRQALATLHRYFPD